MKILRFILLLCLNSIVLLAIAQENESKTDTLKVEFDIDPFIRIGFDVSSVVRYFTETEVLQIEFSADTEFKRDWFAAFEGGFLNVGSDRETFSYNADGFFAKIGIDYNLLGRPDANQNDVVTIGFRYGYSFLQQEAPNFFINNPYWGNYTGNIDRNNFQMHWCEIHGGLKTEIFRNIFLGWSIRVKIRLNETQNPDLQPYYIPGFGHGKRKTAVMLHYSVFYKLGF